MAHLTIADLLKTKASRDIWSVTPQATVYEALQKMADKEIGALLVVDNNRLAGIFSERDYARKIVLKGKSSLDTPVREVMTERVVTVDPSTTVQKSMELMTHHHIRHLPVMSEGRLTGIVSIGDIVKAIISDKEEWISELEDYIQGNSPAKG